MGGRGAARAGTVLAVACAAQFMVVLDVSVVNVALPAIRDDLGFGPSGLPWVAGAYALAFGGFLLLGGRLADLYGHRRVFVAGLLLFSGASLVGGLATGPATLIAARAAQGLGAAVLAPVTLTVLTTAFPEGPARTRALAIWTAVGLTGGAAGNLLGGLLTEAASWRWILLVNVPVGAAAVAAAVRALPAGPPPSRGRRLDLPGAVLVTAGLSALTYGLSRAGEHGGPADPAAAGALALAVVALAAFAAVEARYAAHPLMPPRLLRTRAIAVGNAVMLLAGACFQIPLWYFLTLVMQNVLHYSALRTGAAFLPHTLLTLAVGLYATPRLMRRLDDRVLIATGALVAAAGFLWQSRTGAGDGYVTGVLGPAIPISVGGGLFTTPLTSTVTGGVADGDAGAASGLMNTAKQVGGALGLAALSTFAPGSSGSAAAAYGHAFLGCAAFLAVAAGLALVLPAAPRHSGAPVDAPSRG
ncbi:MULTISPECIES: MFS transporter [Actinomadura]|uniref:MFS transporter n=1 Tax=Actinomadura yumaensis TaxID=111807 RepID=A0ABW2CXC0_9ACTN|nr:MFS transporter [Actinomadura sp. J1-007]MWK38844.1 MFS transporter [Actinomadura sp. J1-007]